MRIRIWIQQLKLMRIHADPDTENLIFFFSVQPFRCRLIWLHPLYPSQISQHLLHIYLSFLLSLSQVHPTSSSWRARVVGIKRTLGKYGHLKIFSFHSFYDEKSSEENSTRTFLNFFGVVLVDPSFQVVPGPDPYPLNQTN